MRAITAPKTISEVTTSIKNSGKTIGLVPTMGALHPGHLSLVSASKAQNDITIVSIFVNPLQFNNENDLLKYPRTLDHDKGLLEALGADYVFCPSSDELYPSKPIISIDFGQMDKVMEGKFRPDHFSGVAVVVSKLFHLIQPDKAYFGLKDLQQFLIIKRMCGDLHFPVELVGMDTIREESGLAMSSRNQRLSDKGKTIAASIYEGLVQCRSLIEERKPINEIIKRINIFYDNKEGLDIEYLEIVDANSLQPIPNYEGIDELAVCIAGYVEDIRLIDNLYLRLK